MAGHGHGTDVGDPTPFSRRPVDRLVSRAVIAVDGAGSVHVAARGAHRVRGDPDRRGALESALRAGVAGPTLGEEPG